MTRVTSEPVKLAGHDTLSYYSFPGKPTYPLYANPVLHSNSG